MNLIILWGLSHHEFCTDIICMAPSRALVQNTLLLFLLKRISERKVFDWPGCLSWKVLRQLGEPHSTSTTVVLYLRYVTVNCNWSETENFISLRTEWRLWLWTLTKLQKITDKIIIQGLETLFSGTSLRWDNFSLRIFLHRTYLCFRSSTRIQMSKLLHSRISPQGTTSILTPSYPESIPDFN